MGEEEKYTPLEVSYAADFYSRLADRETMTNLLGGTLTRSITDNKVFIDCQGIEGRITFKEFDGRYIKLKLQMWVKNDRIKGTEEFENYPCLDPDGIEGKLSQELFEGIINDFYIPNLKYFYSIHKPKQ